MSKEVEFLVKLNVKGGQANPAPPIGPALGAKGVNIMMFCKAFNARTQDKMGELLPVVISVYKDKSFDFIVKTSPVPYLIMKALSLKKGSAEPNRNKVGNLSSEQIQQIGENKMPDLNAFTLNSAMNMVAGTARSMGVTVSGTPPWEA